MLGVEGIFRASTISINRGRPRVTFCSLTPAKWKVRSVIWVPGSPIDWAETIPAASDRKSTRLNSSHSQISYAVFCLKKKNKRFHSIGFRVLLDTHKTHRSLCRPGALLGHD